MPSAGVGRAAAIRCPAAVECRRRPPAGMRTPGDEGMRSEGMLAWLAALLLVAALPCAAQTARPTLELAAGHQEIQKQKTRGQGKRVSVTVILRGALHIK